MQDKYWPFHDLLFANRTALIAENFRRFAAQSGMNVDAFERCVADPAIRSAIDRDVADGRAYGVDATPTLFINGRIVSGAASCEQLSRLVEEEKRKKRGG